MRDALIELCNLCSSQAAYLDDVDKTECEASAAGLDCASLGGKTNADFCKTGGHFCKLIAGSMNSAACDGTCPAPTSTKKQCCSDMPKMVDMYCTGVGKDIKDLMVRILMHVMFELISCRECNHQKDSRKSDRVGVITGVGWGGFRCMLEGRLHFDDRIGFPAHRCALPGGGHVCAVVDGLCLLSRLSSPGLAS